MALPSQTDANESWKLWDVVTLAVTVLLCTALGSVVSVAKAEVLPEPTGPYGLGRLIQHWQDPSRPEVLSSTSSDRRELVVWLWYPATAKEPTAEYVDQLDALAVALPQADVNKARSVHVHAVANAKPSIVPSLFPVLVFSPGGGAMPALYTSLCEDLASHGSLVAAIDHPYDDAAVRLADGRVVKRVEPPQGGEEMQRFQRERVRVRAQDMRFVLDQLFKLNTGMIDSPFRERLDVKHVGAFGHSVGGMTAGQTCMDDIRFAACANMDGVVRMMPLYPDDMGRGPKQPFLFLEKQLVPKAMRGETSAQLQERWTKLLRQGSSLLQNVRSGHTYRITVNGATHATFSDEEIVSLARKGPYSLNLVALTRKYIRAFFDESLLGKQSPFLNSSRSDPAVHIQVFGGQQAAGSH